MPSMAGPGRSNPVMLSSWPLGRSSGEVWMLTVVLGREHVLPGGDVGDSQDEGLPVIGQRGALLRLSFTGRLSCHLSGMSHTSIASSWPWLGKEQPLEVESLNCS